MVRRMTCGWMLGLACCAAPAPSSPPARVVAVPPSTASQAPTPAPAPKHAIGEVTLSHLPALVNDSAYHYARGKDEHLALDPLQVNICYQTALTARPSITGWMLVQQREEPSAITLALVEQEGLPEDLVACVLKARSSYQGSVFFSGTASHLYLRFR